jgi:hypothetical protein
MGKIKSSHQNERELFLLTKQNVCAIIFLAGRLDAPLIQAICPFKEPLLRQHIGDIGVEGDYECRTNNLEDCQHTKGNHTA